MTSPVDPQTLQDVRDEEHLRLLSLFYYISGVITGLVSLIPVIHLLIGFTMLVGAGSVQDSREAAGLGVVGGVMTAIAMTIIVVGLSLAVLKLLAGSAIQKRRWRPLILVAAVFSCISIPYGTILGICTFLVLGRESVIARFQPSRTEAG